MSTPTMQPTEVHVEAVLAAQVDLHCGPREIPATIGPAFGTAFGFIARHGLQCTGAPRVIYQTMDAADVRFTLAIPIAGAPAEPAGPVRVAELPAAGTLRFTHVGPYDRLGETYEGITAWMLENGRMSSPADWAKYMPMWEEYPNDPQTTPPEQLLTYIHLPLAG